MHLEVESLETLHAEIRECCSCPLPDRGPHRFAGRSESRIMLIGQAPAKPFGPLGRPFGRGTGRQRLFDWLSRAGFEEEEFRSKSYMTSVTKCYPGPSPGGKGDRRPSKEEIALCDRYLQGELRIIRPELILLVGQLAIGRFLGESKLSDVVGRKFALQFQGWSGIAVPLPHPSGASLWNNLPENKLLVSRAIDVICELRNELGL